MSDWEDMAETDNAVTGDDKFKDEDVNLGKEEPEEKKGPAPANEKKLSKKKKFEEMEKNFEKKLKVKAPKEEHSSGPISYEEKLRRQKQVEDADHALADELFSDIKGNAGTEDATDKVTLRTEQDYIDYGKAVGQKLNRGDRAFHIWKFFRTALQESKEFMKVDHMQDLLKSFQAQIREKQQAEKSKKGKGKTTNTKASVNVGPRDTMDAFIDDDEDFEGNGQYSDGDFM
eukprot:CAMPEP_0115004128 /NCGR_PEP_ID=MMETSP0216-20121206/19016_1 /TAXON_ID=223996 /ORGANISM="Protocruzia adherens, Strain Boccale" /LENGTH=229 /DNA_ID=CAMNT_0002370053 /DNA_START=119 /DNA_END=808 /DNA_ORIENTATION=+